MKVTRHKDGTVSVRLPRYDSDESEPTIHDILYALSIANDSAFLYGERDPVNNKRWAMDQSARLVSLYNAISGEVDYEH